MPGAAREIILVGLGPHARRVYLPLLHHYQSSGRLRLAAVVELESEMERVNSTLANLGFKGDEVQKIFVSSNGTGDTLTEQVRSQLQRLDSAAGMIISSEPLSHRAYAEWALDAGLSVLIDKPVTTYENISTDLSQARRLLQDYDYLAKKYRQAKSAGRSNCFLVMAQRRYHTSYNIIRAAIAEVFDKTNCPVTAVNTFHSDGQWRTPSEMCNQLYHSYFQGYGKGSHSGYHYFDIVPYILSAGISHEKNFDEIETVASFVRPADFLAQLNIEDHSRILGGDEFRKRHPGKTEDYMAQTEKFGEMDLSAQINFKSFGRILTHWNLALCHNGVSQRNWAYPGDRCLYKGIGRVAHESHIFEQGPFQAIQFHSYKSKDNPLGPDQFGGERHLEIIIYRNNRIFQGEHVQRFRLHDLNLMETKPTAISSPAKAACFEDFLANMEAGGSLSRCDLTAQRSSVEITQSVYESAIQRFHGDNPLVKKRFSLQEARSFQMPHRAHVRAIFRDNPNLSKTSSHIGLSR